MAEQVGTISNISTCRLYNLKFIILYILLEAVTRFLKAKLRVMQEELDRLSSESISKVRIESLCYVMN